MPSRCCPCQVYFLLLLLLQMALSPKAFSRGPRDAGLMARGCLSLKIGHSNNTLLLGQKPIPKVTARLLNASTHHPVDCYTPGANHLGKCLSGLLTTLTAFVVRTRDPTLCCAST